MKNIISKPFILASLVFFASTHLQAADAPKKTAQGKPAVKVEEKKASNTEKTTTEDTTSYTDLLPSPTQNSAVDEQPSAEAEAQKIKDSRWVDQKQLEQAKKDAEAQKKKDESRVKWTAKCTDRSGKTVTATDPGYDNCMHQTGENKKNPGIKTDEKDKNDPGSVGAGFEIKFP